MKTAVRIVSVLLLTGLIAMPAAAGELKVTGFIDNAISTEQNISNVDNDVTNNKDKATQGSTRSQLFFNFIASDDLRGIFGLELDADWGAPARARLGGTAVSQDSAASATASTSTTSS